MQFDELHQSVEKGPAYAGLFVIYMVKYMW